MSMTDGLIRGEVQNFVALHSPNSGSKRGPAAKEGENSIAERMSRLISLEARIPGGDFTDCAADWHRRGNIDDLVDTFAGFHPSLVEICR